MTEDNGNDGTDRGARRRWIIKLFVVGLLLMVISVIGVLIIFGYLPAPTFLLNPWVIGIIGIGVLLALIAYGLSKAGLGKPSFQLFQGQNRKNQLTDEEARYLVRYMCFENGILIGKLRGGVRYVTNQNEEDTRMFVGRVTPRNVAEEVGVVVNLEQDIDFDISDYENHRFDRMDRALRNIRDKQIILASDVEDLDEAIDEVAKSFGKSTIREYERTRYTDEEGRPVVHERGTYQNPRKVPVQVEEEE